MIGIGTRTQCTARHSYNINLMWAGRNTNDTVACDGGPRRANGHGLQQNSKLVDFRNLKVQWGPGHGHIFRRHHDHEVERLTALSVPANALFWTVVSCASSAT